MSNARSATRFAMTLAGRDLSAQIEGSLLGPLWIFLQPLLFFGLVYVVFTYGLRISTVSSEPFVLWFMIGYIPWVYFASCLTDMTSVVRSYAYLIPHQNTVLELFPVIKIISHSLVHIVFLAAVLLFGLSNELQFSPALAGIAVYFILMVLLLLGLGWVVAALSVFSKDLSNLVMLASQFGFWLTPIFWDIAQIPERLRWLVQLNPMYYVVSGYRRSFFGHPYGTDQLIADGIFLGFVLALLFIGLKVFRRLKIHFLEVLD